MREHRGARCAQSGRRPFAIPIGASTPLGALGYVCAMVELLDQIAAARRHRPRRPRRAARRRASSPAAVCSACRPASSASAPTSRSHRCTRRSRAIVGGIGELLDLDAGRDCPTDAAIEVDDRFVGDGYGIPTDASREAIELAARTEAMFLDPTYTAKAMAGLIAYVRQQKFDDRPDRAVLAHRRTGRAVRVAAPGC